MALTPAEIDALPTYTNAQMVKLLQHCVAELASSPESSVQGPNGRAYTMRDMEQLRSMLRHYEELDAIDLENSELATTGCPVVTYQEPQV